MNELEAVLKEINDHVANLQEHIGTGMAKDFADYQFMCGKISGLLSIHRYIKDLQQHMENSDE